MTRKNNSIAEKSMAFAVRIVDLYRYLSGQKHEGVMSKQILRSGTSVGANVREANSAQSKSDFISKMSIALKECDETGYWLANFRQGRLRCALRGSTRRLPTIRIQTATESRRPTSFSHTGQTRMNQTATTTDWATTPRSTRRTPIRTMRTPPMAFTTTGSRLRWEGLIRSHVPTARPIPCWSMSSIRERRTAPSRILYPRMKWGS